MNLKTETMKAISKKIDKAYEIAEMGLLTKDEVMRDVRIIRAEIRDTYPDGSDESVSLVGELIDLEELAYKL